MQKRRPSGSGAVLLGGEQSPPTKSDLTSQPFDEVARLRAMHLMVAFSMRPELATICAALAFQVQS